MTVDVEVASSLAHCVLSRLTTLGPLSFPLVRTKPRLSPKSNLAHISASLSRDGWATGQPHLTPEAGRPLSRLRQIPQTQTYTYPATTISSIAQVPTYRQPPQHPLLLDDKTSWHDSRYRMTSGLSRIGYTILVAIIILAILGAGYGGAIGAVAASKAKDCS